MHISTSWMLFKGQTIQIWTVLGSLAQQCMHTFLQKCTLVVRALLIELTRVILLDMLKETTIAYDYLITIELSILHMCNSMRLWSDLLCTTKRIFITWESWMIWMSGWTSSFLQKRRLTMTFNQLIRSLVRSQLFLLHWAFTRMTNWLLTLEQFQILLLWFQIFVDLHKEIGESQQHIWKASYQLISHTNN